MTEKLILRSLIFNVKHCMFSPKILWLLSWKLATYWPIHIQGVTIKGKGAIDSKHFPQVTIASTRFPEVTLFWKSIPPSQKSQVESKNTFGRDIRQKTWITLCSDAYMNNLRLTANLLLAFVSPSNKGYNFQENHKN